MNYYERHLGDYARDTAHLSVLEHGAYTLLLDRYYASEQPIPADQAHRVARARSVEERKAVDTVLAEFFTLEGGVYMQKRVQAEIERAHHRIETARSNGRTGGRPKKNPAGFNLHNRNGTDQKPSGLSVGSKTETGLKALQTPDSKHQSPEEDSLRSPSCAQEPNETQRDIVPRGTSAAKSSEGESGTNRDADTLRAHARWQEHFAWALATLPPIYPTRIYTEADWQSTCRTIAGYLDTGQTTRDALLQLARDFAAQQDAKGNRNTKFIEKPQRHYDGEGKWRGPFVLPEEPGAQQETAMDRIRRLNPVGGANG